MYDEPKVNQPLKFIQDALEANSRSYRFYLSYSTVFVSSFFSEKRKVLRTLERKSRRKELLYRKMVIV